MTACTRTPKPQAVRLRVSVRGSWRMEAASDCATTAAALTPLLKEQPTTPVQPADAPRDPPAAITTVGEQFYRFNPYCQAPRMLLSHREVLQQFVWTTVHAMQQAQVSLSPAAMDDVAVTNNTQLLRQLELEAATALRPSSFPSCAEVVHRGSSLPRHAASVSSVRLQYALRQRLPATYAVVVGQVFQGKWHQFIASISGLHSFIYSAATLEEHPDLQWCLCSDELRVSTVSMAASLPNDVLCGQWVRSQFVGRFLPRYIARVLDVVLRETHWAVYRTCRTAIWREDASRRASAASNAAPAHPSSSSSSQHPSSAQQPPLLISSIFSNVAWLHLGTTMDPHSTAGRRSTALIELVHQAVDATMGVASDVMRLATDCLEQRLDTEMPTVCRCISRIQLRRYVRQCLVRVIRGATTASVLPASQCKDYEIQHVANPSGGSPLSLVPTHGRSLEVRSPHLGEGLDYTLDGPLLQVEPLLDSSASTFSTTATDSLLSSVTMRRLPPVPAVSAYADAHPPAPRDGQINDWAATLDDDTSLLSSRRGADATSVSLGYTAHDSRTSLDLSSHTFLVRVLKCEAHRDDHRDASHAVPGTAAVVRLPPPPPPTVQPFAIDQFAPLDAPLPAMSSLG